MTNRLTTIIVTFITISINLIASGQAKKPTLMVIPSDYWCGEAGYILPENAEGKSTFIPDYEKALQNDLNLYNALTKIGELMSDRGFPLKDLASCIKNVSRSIQEDEMTFSKNSGASLAESPLEQLLNRAKADIIVELTWNVSRIGPKTAINYTLKGIDAYSAKQIAATQGIGKASYNTELPLLLEEAILENMDLFLAQLQAHFDDLLENGREVNVNVRIFDNGSGMDMDTEYDGNTLTDIIDDWMAQNTENHRYNLTDATSNTLRFEQVRIPLYRENGTPMDTRRFVSDLRKVLSKAPYNIDCKIVTRGLGRADLILEEK